MTKYRVVAYLRIEPDEDVLYDTREEAEADVERRAVRNTLKAGEKDAFWAANMTFLERRYPERWGRRQDDASVPKVIVQIGARDSDVQVNVITPSPTPFALDAPEQGAPSD